MHVMLAGKPKLGVQEHSLVPDVKTPACPVSTVMESVSMIESKTRRVPPCGSKI